MGAVCHTVNPRLSADDIAFIMTDARDCILFADPSFAALLTETAPAIASCVHAVVLLTDAAGMKDVALAPSMRLHCYETLLAEADEDYVWPDFDENTASALCYTSGTTGRPKGVLYSHRATMLHTYAVNSAEIFGLRSVDRVLPAASMYHACAWGLPYCATMVGAALILPGRHLDGASLFRLLESERVTMTAGVPTIWLGLLAHLRGANERLTHLKRMVVAGSALPRLLIEEFTPMGVNVEQGWGMTETSPIVTYNSPTPATADLTGEEAIRQRLKQGRAALRHGRQDRRRGRARTCRGTARRSAIFWCADTGSRREYLIAAPRARPMPKAGSGPAMSAPSTRTAAPRSSIAPRT